MKFILVTKETKRVNVLYISGQVESIILHRDGPIFGSLVESIILQCGRSDSWFVEHVAIEHHTEDKAHFPLSRWIPADTDMKFNKFDSQLPQFVKRSDPHLYDQREKELERKKSEFAYGPIDDRKGMPRNVSRCI